MTTHGDSLSIWITFLYMTIPEYGHVWLKRQRERIFNLTFCGCMHRFLNTVLSMKDDKWMPARQTAYRTVSRSTQQAKLDEFLIAAVPCTIKSCLCMHGTTETAKRVDLFVCLRSCIKLACDRFIVKKDSHFFRWLGLHQSYITQLSPRAVVHATLQFKLRCDR